MNDSPKKKRSEDDAFVRDIYETSKQELPPQSIDDAILAMAKKQANSGPTSSNSATPHKRSAKNISPWWKKVKYQGTVAASVAIICLVYILQPQIAPYKTQAPDIASRPVEEATQLDSFSSAPAANRALIANQDKARLMQSEMLEQKRKISRYQLEEAEASERADIAELETMRSAAQTQSVAKSETSTQKLIVENKKIIARLTAIQSELKLKHTQIVASLIAQEANKDTKANTLISEYQQQHKVMKSNLAEILANTPNFTLADDYLRVLSVAEIEELQVNDMKN